jgi:cytochrome P450
VFFYLSRYPECYKALAQEIRSTFENGEDISYNEKLVNCHYLRACIDEAMRMSPPSPGALWREQSLTDTSEEPLVVDGHVIPKGTQLGVSLYALHHNEAYFPEPFFYKPERWLGNNSDEQTRVMREAFNPFSIGSRACAGKAMAYMEASLAIARTIWHFDFKAAPGIDGQLGAGTAGDKNGREHTSEFQIFDIFSATHDGPNLVFQIRKAAA